MSSPLCIPSPLSPSLSLIQAALQAESPCRKIRQQLNIYIDATASYVIRLKGKSRATNKKLFYKIRIYNLNLYLCSIKCKTHEGAI